MFLLFVRTVKIYKIKTKWKERTTPGIFKTNCTHSLNRWHHRPKNQSINGFQIEAPIARSRTEKKGGHRLTVKILSVSVWQPLVTAAMILVNKNALERQSHGMPIRWKQWSCTHWVSWKTTRILSVMRSINFPAHGKYRQLLLLCHGVGIRISRLIRIDYEF